MSPDLIRYYFYLEEDAPAIGEFQTHLEGHNVICQSFKKLKEETARQSCYLQMKNGNINILVVRLFNEGHPAKESEALLQQLEDLSLLTTDNLLGKVSVWVTCIDDFEELKKTLQISRRESIRLKMLNGDLFRLTLFWPRGHAQYICTINQKNDISETFLFNGLPMIESNLLQLHLIDNLYRERHAAIEKQTLNFDKRLSVILHTDLVSRESQSKQVDDLETQLNELSKAYGITAGNKNVIMEGIYKIKPQIENISRQISTEKALQITPEAIGKLMEPFVRRLDSLVRISENLNLSMQSHQAAIDVVESKVGLMNSRQNISTQEKIKDLLELNAIMQKQSLIFQISAAAIEFIVIAYYSHSLWKAMAVDAYHAIPGWVQLIFVLLFSGNIVYCTHLVGEYIQDKEDEHVKKNLLISLIPLSIILLVVLVSSFLLGNNAAH